MMQERKILIICNTYYQIILAIQMKFTIMARDNVDLWISDHSNNADEVAKRLKQVELFSDVELRYTKDFTYKRTKFKGFLDVFEYTFNNKRSYKLYDEVIFYNLELELYAMADYYKKILHKTVWSRFEEGILSYDTDFVTGKRIRFMRMLRKLLGKYDVQDKVRKFYCFFPKLKKTYREWDFIQIPLIDDKNMKFKEVLNYTFNYKPKTIKEKYIFFASSSDIDGRPFGETELILKLGSKVGRENLLVKIHPRDNRIIFSDHGISIMENSSVPWEVMQLNGGFEEKCFITVNSGAFLSVSACTHADIKAFYVLDSVKSDSAVFQDRKNLIISILESLHKQNICMGIRVGGLKNIL